MAEEFSVVGKPLTKPDAYAKVSGQTKFADDLALPRMLFGRILRSPYPHARLLHVDTSRARAHAGVLAVLTGDDMPVKFGILPVSQDEEALAREKVRYVGDPIAAVAATDEWIADEALDLIDVQFAELPHYMSIPEALIDQGEPIHGSSNVHKAVALEFGDTEAAMRAAEHVREDIVFFEGNTHLPMEQHAAVAQYAAEGKLTLWTSSQTPHYVHRALGNVLELPMSRIRVIATPNGGGFGGKSDIFSHELVAAKLAIATGRPVKITLTRAPRPPPGADEGQDWVHTRRSDYRPAISELPRWWRLRQLRRREHVLHGCPAGYDVRHPPIPLRRRAPLHQQAALRSEAWPRHAAAAVCARNPSRQSR